MSKLNNKKIRWAVKQVVSGVMNTKEAAEIYKVSQRWIQVIVKKYKEEYSSKQNRDFLRVMFH